MAFYAGKSASITISATARPFDTWDVELKAEIVDTTNFTSSGYQENLAGVFSADVTFSGPYDGSEAVAQGDSVAITFGTGGGGPTLAPTVRISSAKVSTATRNKAATIAYSGTSNGTYSITL